uniref:DNA repair protein putative n=1 Tax=Albugo laibachii Nc14 TaxID=890382 RepID=F0WZM6_9STRA|nr:DNA repair protein putative [Albugo laibachii Nc14]|eukprot:CCA26951.1 DNA repair protein putative [Albugo laibachii Nc14]
MGVQNLWLLLSPVGRQIEIESLENKRLAVDASIWLVQFVKAMRDDQGHMIKNAHLIGTFHRVSKLLHYGIRPVFVFDGQTPVLKQQTLERRRKRVESQTLNWKQTAQKILLNRLHILRQEMLNGPKTEEPAAIDPNYLLPQATNVEAIREHSQKPSIPADKEQGAESDHSASEDEILVDDIALDTKDIYNVNPEAVYALPPNLQKNMFEKIMRQLRQTSRNEFIPLAGDPEAYSRSQIKSFLARSRLHQKFMQVRQQNIETQIKNDSSNPELVSAKRLAGDGDRYYILNQPKEADAASKKRSSKSLISSESDIFPLHSSTNEESFSPLRQIHQKRTSEGFRSRFAEDKDDSLHSEASDHIEEPIVEALQHLPLTNPLRASAIDFSEDKPLAIELARGQRIQSVELHQSVEPDIQVLDAHPPLVMRHMNTLEEVHDGESDIEWEEVEMKSDFKSADSKSPEVQAKDELAGVITAASDSPEEAVLELKDVETEEADLDAIKNELEDAKGEGDLRALREEALNSAIATASNLTQWAAGAVRKALAPHTTVKESHGKLTPTIKMEPPPKAEIPIQKIEDIDESSDEALMLAMNESMEDCTPETPNSSRYLLYDTSSSDIALKDTVETSEALHQKERELKTLQNRQLRDMEGFDDEMVEQVMELLTLFGVPFLVCPMEAEAQCATLEQLGLVDGIVTDDSDIFPFGGTKVYKNIFHHQKFVEAFDTRDIERELGFTRADMISLALLLGSDYTPGVRGIGIVNAAEIISSFGSSSAGLKEFKAWIEEFDVHEEANRRKEKRKGEEELEKMSPKDRFKYTHASVRRKWELGETFPNAQVMEAYLHPQVDTCSKKFQWSLPDFTELKNYCTQVFGWEMNKIDGMLTPLAKTLENSSRHKETQKQTRIDEFFRTYNDNVKYAKFKSKRLKSAIGSANSQKNKKRYVRK